MLCEFAHRFPRYLANLLERDRFLTRNFREETATDLLMMGLVALHSLSGCWAITPSCAIRRGRAGELFIEPQSLANRAISQGGLLHCTM
jgi:hypothetical protein